MSWGITTATADGVSPTNGAALGSEMTTNSNLLANSPRAFIPGGFQANRPGDIQVYIEFTVSPLNPGEIVTYESISFATYSTRNNADFVLLASDDGFASSSVVTSASLPQGRTTLNFVNQDLSFLGATSETVTFRLALTNASGAGQQFGFINNPAVAGPGGMNVRVNGTVEMAPPDSLVTWDVVTATSEGVEPTNQGATGSLMTTTFNSLSGFAGGYNPSGFRMNTLEDAPDAIEFSVSPAGPGQEITYHSISYAVFCSRTHPDFDLLASDDGFATSWIVMRNTDRAAFRTTVDFPDVDLSFLGTTAETITFRLIPYGIASAANFGFMNNPSVRGPGGMNVFVRGTVTGELVAPSLEIEKDSGLLTLSWMASGNDWVLAQSDDLSNWIEVAETPTEEGA